MVHGRPRSGLSQPHMGHWCGLWPFGSSLVLAGAWCGVLVGGMACRLVLVRAGWSRTWALVHALLLVLGRR